MNVVCLTGNVVREPEFRELSTAVAEFTLACAHPFSKEKTSFIKVVAWAKAAEIVRDYVIKGQRVGVTGYIVTGDYESEGKKIFTTKVNADKIEFLSKKPDESNKKEANINDDIAF